MLFEEQGKRIFEEQLAMSYKIEAKYTYGWDDAGWTDDEDFSSVPMRFETPAQAREALNDYFAAVRVAVAEGDMDVEENVDHYRIVEAFD